MKNCRSCRRWARRGNNYYNYYYIAWWGNYIFGGNFIEKIQSIDLATKVLEANDRWDNEEVTYQEAKDEFANFIEDAEQFVSTVTEPGPPTTFAGLVKSHEELKAIVELIYIDSQELLEGLTSSDTGERRAAALDSFNNNINQFQEKIEEIVATNTSG